MRSKVTHDLQVGESRTATIRARRRWNRTDIHMAPGRYALKASGAWWDLVIRCGADGWRRIGGARKPDAPLFALIGALDCDESSRFVIGSGRLLATGTGGQLCCYANDLPGMYWNNWGAVSLTVTRLE